MNNKKDNISQFDELFKQGLENHSVKAPGGVFEAVSAATSSSAAGATKLFVAKWVIGGLVATTMAVGGYYALSSDDQAKESAIQVSEEAIASTLSEGSLLDEGNPKKGEETKIISGGAKMETADVEVPSEIVIAQSERPRPILKDSVVFDLGDDHDFYHISDHGEKIEVPRTNYTISIDGDVCQGSTFSMSLNATIPVEWYINDERLTISNPKIEYQFLSKSPYKVEVYIRGFKVADTFIDMSKPKVKVQFADLGSDVNELSASTSGIRSAVWEFEGKELSNQRKFVYDARLYTSQPYLVTTDKRGCKDTFRTDKSERNAHFKIVQNVITPDGDGKNDDYEVEISGYEMFRLIITDKNGKPVFSTNDPKVHWKGLNQVTNAPCENGVYGVFVTYKLKDSTKAVKEYDKVLLTK